MFAVAFLGDLAAFSPGAGREFVVAGERPLLRRHRTAPLRGNLALPLRIH
jgi:hypothetical protein